MVRRVPYAFVCFLVGMLAFSAQVRADSPELEPEPGANAEAPHAVQPEADAEPSERSPISPPESSTSPAPAVPTGYGGQLAPEAYYPDVDRKERRNRLGIPGDWRISLGFHAGLTGWAEFFDSSGASYQTDLSPAYGVDLQVQKPFLKYVVVGLDLFYRSFGLDEVERRIPMVSADVLVGLRYAFRFDRVAIEPFVSVGVGVAFLPDGDALGASDPEFGVDVFTRAGLNFWPSDHFGTYLAAGARSTTFWVRETVAMTQHSLEVGVIFRGG